MNKKMLVASVAFAGLVAVALSGDATARGLCANSSYKAWPASGLLPTRGSAFCAHPTDSYVMRLSCPSGYSEYGSSTRCRKSTGSSGYSNLTTPTCKVGHWKCVQKGTDKCYSKKHCKGTYKGYISCSGSKTRITDYSTGYEDKCGTASSAYKYANKSWKMTDPCSNYKRKALYYHKSSATPTFRKYLCH